MLRAIYVGDVRFDVCNVFEYNEKTKMFEMINDRDCAYHFDSVMKDVDFIVFATDGSTVFQVETKNKEIY